MPVRLFCIFIMSLSIMLDVGFAQSPKTWQTLLNEPLLRFYFDNSPGLGHQAHTSIMIRRIKEAGFSGRIEVLYLEPQKIGLLFPRFNSKKKDQYDPDNDIRFVQLFDSPLTYLEKPSLKMTTLAPVPFVLTGGEDSHRFNSRYLSEVLQGQSIISINPYGWPSGSYVQEVSGRRLDFESLITLSIKPSTFTWIGENIDEKLVADLDESQKTDYVFPFYANEKVAENLLIKLVSSLETTTFSKGITIPVFNKFTPRQWENLKRKIRQLESKGIHSQRSIEIVYIGPVGQVTFNHIFSNKKFPLVFVSGRNSIGLAMMTGQAFMEAQFVFENSFIEPSLYVSSSWRAYDQAHTELLHSQKTGSLKLGSYIKLVVEGHEDSLEIFSTFKTALNSRADKLWLGFDKALVELERWEIVSTQKKVPPFCKNLF